MSQPQANTAANTTFDVHLAVYDLSQGMARSLSAQFLGPAHALDVIPHTGLVVYGREYFFGGGIQSEDPTLFRQSTGMQPISQERLGATNVTKAEFEAWCAQCMRNGRFTVQSYDLLERNCNNFCQDAAVEGLGLPNGIPAWILDVPRRFLASPMGQMIRPMLQQMQVTGSSTSNSLGTGISAPFSTAAPPVTTVAPSPSADVNPWANLPSSSSSAAASSGTTSEQVARIHNKEQSESDSIKGNVIATTPTLDSFAKPLLSNDAKAAPLCAKKLVASSLLQDEDKAALTDIGDALVVAAKAGTTVISQDLVEASSKAILSLLSTGEQVTFALMLFRLIVLHPPPLPANGGRSNHVTVDDSTCSSLMKCLNWIIQQVIDSNNENTDTTAEAVVVFSPAAKSMAWCTLSNAYGTDTVASLSSSTTASSLVHSHLEALVEVAMADLSTPDDESSPLPARQAAAAFLYNVSLSLTRTHGDDDNEELSDLLVSLLCASLDGISLEQDVTCQLRRLLVAANIVMRRRRCTPSCASSDNDKGTSNIAETKVVIHAAAKSLVHDLGFTDTIQEVAVATTTATGDAATVHKVATELMTISGRVN